MPLKAEIEGEAEVRGIRLKGIADRLDRIGTDGLAIVDYKTGQPSRPKAIDAGFALQLGLLGLIARAGGFPGVASTPEATRDTPTTANSMCLPMYCQRVYGSNRR